MLLLHGGLDGVRLVFLVAINEVLDESQTISGITKLDNFKFIPDSITCWRAYCIDRGRTVKTSSGKNANCNGPAI